MDLIALADYWREKVGTYSFVRFKDTWYKGKIEEIPSDDDPVIVCRVTETLDNSLFEIETLTIPNTERVMQSLLPHTNDPHTGNPIYVLPTGLLLNLAKGVYASILFTNKKAMEWVPEEVRGFAYSCFPDVTKKNHSPFNLEELHKPFKWVHVINEELFQDKTPIYSVEYWSPRTKARVLQDRYGIFIEHDLDLKSIEVTLRLGVGMKSVYQTFYIDLDTNKCVDRFNKTLTP